MSIRRLYKDIASDIEKADHRLRQRPAGSKGFVSLAKASSLRK